MQLSLNFEQPATNHTLAGCLIEQHASFVGSAEALRWFTQLESDTPWAQSEIVIFGKRHPIPRLNAWYGEKAYTYSGNLMDSLPMTELLSTIRKRVEAQTGCSFNSVLINLYRNNNDTVGWHADDEPELDPKRPIASLSLGASRRFVLREKRPQDHPTKPQKLDLTLESGDLIVMHPPTQLRCEHTVPRTAKATGPRINLTFRTVL